MFSHMVVGSNDVKRAKAFYDATLGALGVAPAAGGDDRIYYRTPTGTFIVTKPLNGEPASAANGGTIGFSCASSDQVDAWHAAGVAAGGTSIEEPPGEREGPTGKLYLAYLRDLDGNKLCGMCRLS